MELLHETVDEIDRLLDAGARLAKGDYRVGRVLPSLREAARTAPVLGRVADALDRAVSAPPEDAADALLEARTLAVAALRVQAGFAAPDDGVTPKPLQGLDLAGDANQGCRALSELSSALTERGAGRYRVVEAGAADGRLRDFRLIPALVTALGDPYEEIALAAKTALAAFGAKAAPAVRAGLHESQKDWMCLRFLVETESTDADELEAIALDAKRSPRCREEAVRALESFPGAIPFLVDQVAGRNRALAAAAAEALSAFDDAAALDALVAYVDREKDPGDLVAVLRARTNPSLLEWVGRSADASLQAYAQTREDAALARATFFLGALTPEHPWRTRVVRRFASELDALAGLDGPRDDKRVRAVMALTRALYYDKTPEDAASFLRWRGSMAADYVPAAFQLSYLTENHDEFLKRFLPLVRLPADDKRRVAFVDTFRRLCESPHEEWSDRVAAMFGRVRRSFSARWKDALCDAGHPSLASFFPPDADDASFLKVLEKGDFSDPEVLAAFDRAVEGLCALGRRGVVERVVEYLAFAKSKGARFFGGRHYAAGRALAALPASRLGDLKKASDRAFKSGDQDIAEALASAVLELEKKENA